MTDQRAIRKFVSSIPDLDRRLKALETKPQLASSSIEDGSVDVNDGDGKLVGRVGKQDDGTFTAKSLDGPPPPEPEPVSDWKPFAGGVSVRVPGTFAGGEDTPKDFKQFDVHFSTTASDRGSDPHGAASLFVSTDSESAVWLDVNLGSTDDYTVWIVARSESRQFSVPSAPVTVTADALVDAEQIEADIQDAKDRINAAQQEIAQTGQELDAALGDNTGTLADAEQAITTAQGQLTTAQGQIADAESDLSDLSDTVDSYDSRISTNADQIANLQEGSGGNVIHNETGKPGNATGNNGDIWNRWDTLTVANNPKLIQSWVYTNNAWLKVDMDPSFLPKVDIGSGTFGSLDGNRLKVSSVEAGQINAQSVAAATGQFIDLDVSQLTVAGQATISEAVAEAIVAKTATIITLDVGQLTASSANLGTAVADKLFTDIFAAHKITAEQLLVGDMTNMMVNGDFHLKSSDGGSSVYYGFSGIAAHADGEGPNGENIATETLTNDGTWYGPYQSSLVEDELGVLHEGETYVFSYDFRWSSPSNKSDGAVHIRGRGPIGNIQINSWSVEDFEPGEWHNLSGQYTVPKGKGGHSFLRPTVYHPSGDETFDTTNLRVGPAVGATIIEDGAITTSKLYVTEDMTAALLRAKKVEADEIAGNAVDGMTITGAVVQTDSATDTGVKLSPAGIESWDSSNNRTFFVSQAGDVTISGEFQTDDYDEEEQTGAIFSNMQSQVQNLNVIEDIAADTGNFEQIMLNGDPVDPDAVAEAAPRGLIAYGQVEGATEDSKTFTSASDRDHPMLRFDIGPMYAGRQYLISFKWNLAGGASSDCEYRTAIRYTNDGTGVTRNSSSMPGTYDRFTGYAYKATGYTQHVYRPANDYDMLKVALYVYVAKGTFQMSFSEPLYQPEAVCTDLGYTNSNGNQLRQASYASDQGDDGGGDSGGNQTPSKTRHKRTYKATWSASWDRNGKRSNGDRYMYQGNLYTGHHTSACGLDAVTIASDLAGVPNSDIESVKIKYRVAHTYWNSSVGMKVRPCWHNHTGEPANSPSLIHMSDFNRTVKAGSTYTMNVGASFAGHIRDGDITGIGFDSTGGSHYYGYMYGYNKPGPGLYKSRPSIEIVYRK